MKSRIIVGMAALIIFFAGLYIYENKLLFPNKLVSPGDVKLKYSLGGCAHKNEEEITRTKSLTGYENSLEIFFADNKIFVNQVSNWVCCAEIKVDKEIKGNEIKIIETKTNVESCRCMCAYTINSTIENLKKGTYTVSVYGIDQNLVGGKDIVVG